MKLRDFLILAGGVAAASQVSALSLGSSQGNVQLGQPLDLVFQVHADAGQTAQSSCVLADVWMGDTPVNSSQVLLTAQDQSVRIRTTESVHEPLITLKLRAGCAGEVSRSYTFFADPPSTLSASVQPIDLSKIHLSPASTVSRPVAPAIRPRPNRPVRVAKRAINPQALQEATASEISNTVVPAPESATVDAANMHPDTKRDTAPPAVTTSADTEKPRLRMEPLEGLEHSQALAAQGASSDKEPLDSSVISVAADPQAQLLLDANASRLEAMEAQLKTLQQQLSRNHSEISGLQTQLAQAQNPDLPVWIYFILGLLALALATIAWLLQRIQHERRNAKRTWADTVSSAENAEHATKVGTRAHAMVWPSASGKSAPMASRNTATMSAAVNKTSSMADALHSGASLAATTGAQPGHLGTPQWEQLQPDLNTPASSHSPVAEILTAQALFDVQEQAEFYASIGENDQAIAIFQAHIAEHEASSPLAYLELLQLLYRLNRKEAFEEVREKFQNHFNVDVPNFLDFAHKGRDLWSGHPDVLRQIEVLWPTDSVQNLLQDLIVRRNTPGFTESQIRFDLAAFDDLLMLYNVAKTSPASSRGQLPGNMRTAPHEVPLPEVILDPAASVPGSQYQPQQIQTLSPSSPILPVADAYLDLLSPDLAQSPTATPKPYTDSPFQTPSHFSLDEALMDGLSLDLGTTAPASVTSSNQQNQTLDALDEELKNFMRSEENTPQDPHSGKAQ